MNSVFLLSSSPFAGRSFALPKKLLSNLPDIQKQKTSSSPTILQESSNVEVAKDPPGSTSLSTISTLSTTQVPVLVKDELIEYCRLCAASDCVGELLNLQSDDALRKLVLKMTKRLNTNIDFSQEHLPTTICSACVKALYTAYDFVVGIDQAQITLNNKLIQKGVHQMPGNRYLDNNPDLSSRSLQQVSTNKGTTVDEFEFEQKPLHVPSTDFLLTQVSSNNEVAASDFKQPLLPGRTQLFRLYKYQPTLDQQFPTDFVLANCWRDIIQRTRNEDQWKPHKTSVVCSAHFADDDLYLTKTGLRRLKHGSVPNKCLFLSATETESSINTKQLLSNLPESQKQKTPSSPTILQGSSNVEGVTKDPPGLKSLSTISTLSATQESSNVEVAKDPPGSTSLSTTSTLLTTQVPVLVKEEIIEYCRLCAASDCVGELLNILSDDALRKLVVKMTKRLNTNIDFSQEHLPTTICSACVKALYTAYDFVVGIDQAQITLNNKLIQKGVHQMPGNSNLDNNLDLSSMSLQQEVRVSSNNAVASDFKPLLLPVSNTTVPLIQVSTNIGPAVSKIEQPAPLESSSNSPTWQDDAAKRMKCSSYDLSKQVQRIDGQRKNIKILNQKIRRLQKRNESLKNLIITLKKKNTDTNPFKKFKQ
ncbi:unnamed protein product [Parnassius apollo]|uniref:(apollo) hypothetical protein n=1 Tax=Parnassius apollo TaxID=110799 RepID=A0A8S3XR86_PARAO|nr:unnamed protein product [Parnassius apollo]